MSISNLLSPNGYNIYCKSLTNNESNFVTSNCDVLESPNIETNNLNVTEYNLPLLYLFNGNVPIIASGGSTTTSIQLRYNRCGLINLFYDSVTSQIVTQTPISSIKLSTIPTAPGQFDITGLPEIYGNNNDAISYSVYLLVNGVYSITRLNLTKVNSTSCRLEFFEDSNTFDNVQVRIYPFVVKYVDI